MRKLNNKNEEDSKINFPNYLGENEIVNMRNYSPNKIKDYVKYYLYDYPKIKVEYVSEYILGSHVLGRAFPSKRLIQILYNLYGTLKEKVKKHEMLHVEHPDWSEYKVREASDTLHI